MYPSSPLSGYVGGKYRMLPRIVPLVNSFNFELYAEPFCGGASVFFAIQKHRRITYILNDINDNIVNFYVQCKTNTDALLAVIHERCLVSRAMFDAATKIFKEEIPATPVDKAWATFYLLKVSWSCIIGGVFCANLRTINDLPNSAARLQEICKEMQNAQLNVWTPSRS